eukprot:TRINITY_DN21029_c0_g1_i1.p1 TRINITY_DN21029_c0_g1~~TRINITY_DN21029_c0_g1_i1.p1  ORF type:complete len:475 (+),score=113.54 TRINITY_DN21029_c0_g1_i1:298-1722(+)
MMSRSDTFAIGLLQGSALNLTEYLEPRSASFAPFFHLWRYIRALRAAPHFWRAAGGFFEQQYVEEEEDKPVLDVVRRLLSSDEAVDADVADLLAALADGRRDVSRARSGRRCSATQAALLLAAADVERLRLAETHGPEWWMPAGAEARRRLEQGQACMQEALLDLLPSAGAAVGGPGALVLGLAASSSWAVAIEILDRLDSKAVVPLELARAGRIFWIHLLPTRNIEANHVRGLRTLHCDVEFKDFFSRRKRPSRETGLLGFVEVGASLGGCTFHALTEDPDALALAVEPYRPAAVAMRRTAAANGLADRLAVLEAFVCDERCGGLHAYQARRTVLAPWLQQPDWADDKTCDPRSDGGFCVPAVRLDKLLQERGFWTVDVLRIHVLGRELAVLRSAVGLLEARRIRAVVVAIFGKDDDRCSTQEAVEIARLLRRFGFEVRYAGASGDFAEALLAEVCEEQAEGTGTLIAELLVQ